MSIIFGPVQIKNVSGGNIQFGDIYRYSPSSNSSSTSGSGSENSGGVVLTNNGASTSQRLNPFLNDLLIDTTISAQQSALNNQPDSGGPTGSEA
ncbi:spore germination protein [Bacillus sp. 31A1R]|uniref:Spore germination protein n=1 Tax=Robertmurraya mangrovi TaxID=3098077 RepID=A0ABU5J2Y6_9BACI|nr:spore germination protein [Bacillus sp. 31A1R]MDZ5473788.1 spore germination protein [Bacillus sp. 31A1R]